MHTTPEAKRFLYTGVIFNKLIIFLFLLFSTQVIGCACSNKKGALRNSPTTLALALGAITPSNVHELTDMYHPEAIFVDPEVKKQGVNEIVSYFREILEFFKVEDTIINQVIQDKEGLIVCWDSYVSLKGQPLSQFKSIKYEMVSVLKFDSQGKIKYRKDYFDQFTLYQAIPGFKEEVNNMLSEYITNNSINSNP